MTAEFAEFYKGIVFTVLPLLFAWALKYLSSISSSLNHIEKTLASEVAKTTKHGEEIQKHDTRISRLEEYRRMN